MRPAKPDIFSRYSINSLKIQVLRQKNQRKINGKGTDCGPGNVGQVGQVGRLAHGFVSAVYYGNSGTQGSLVFYAKSILSIQSIVSAVASPVICTLPPGEPPP